MAEIIDGCMHLIDNAKKAAEAAGIEPQVIPIRGGTDGCQLSFKDFLARTLERADMPTMDHTSILL